MGMLVTPINSVPSTPHEKVLQNMCWFHSSPETDSKIVEMTSYCKTR